MSEYRVIEGDCLGALRELDAGSVQTCITSPPYFGLRDYGHDGQIGLEQTPEEYVEKMVAVFCEVRRVLRDDGTLWLNLGDSYAGSQQTGGTASSGINASAKRHAGMAPITVGVPSGCKPKDLLGIPWMVAFALRADGWYLRSDIIWHKPNPMPESVTDRPTKAHEYLFLLSKSSRYYYDACSIHEAIDDPALAGKAQRVNYADESKLGRSEVDPHVVIRRPTRNKRSVWTVTAQAFPGAHFATFPPKLIEPCVLAGSKPKADWMAALDELYGKDRLWPASTVLDPFSGAGTTGVVALRNDRDYIGIELNPEYAQMARDRIYDDGPLLNVENAA